MLPGVELARRRRVHYHGDGAPSAGGAGEHHHHHHYSHYPHRAGAAAAAGVVGPALAARIRLEEKLRGAALPPATSPSRWSRLMGEREGRAAATADRRSRREQAQQQQQQQAERGDLAPGAGAVFWPSPSPPAPTTPVTTMVAVPPASASPAGNRRRAELTRTLSMVDVCAVCLEEVRERRQRVTRLPCSHKYHSDCVLPWLAIHPDCPCCRALVPSVDAIALP